MALKGLYWDHVTGKGRIRKNIGGKTIQRRFHAASWDEAEGHFYKVLAEPSKPKEGAVSFIAAATRYLQTEEKKSLDRDAECLNQIMPFIGKLPLEQIHQGTIDPYILKRREDGVKSGTVGRELAVVRRILILASRLWRDQEGRPWLAGAPPLLRFPDWNDKRKPYALDADEQKRLLELLPDHLRDMTIFALNTGMRQNNVCYLRWEWERKIKELGNRSVFLIPAKHMKNRYEALIPINRKAQAVLDSVRPLVAKAGEEHPEFVFTYKGKPVQRINNSGWRKAWRAAGLPAEEMTMGGPHNLRHTFARQLRASRVPHEAIKSLLSHVDGDVTMRYAPSEIKVLLDIVDNLVEQQTILRVTS